MDELSVSDAVSKETGSACSLESSEDVFFSYSVGRFSRRLKYCGVSSSPSQRLVGAGGLSHEGRDVFVATR